METTLTKKENFKIIEKSLFTTKHHTVVVEDVASNQRWYIGFEFNNSGLVRDSFREKINPELFSKQKPEYRNELFAFAFDNLPTPAVSLDGVREHECKYCGATTTQPDSECYKAPLSTEKCEGCKGNGWNGIADQSSTCTICNGTGNNTLSTEKKVVEDWDEVEKEYKEYFKKTVDLFFNDASVDTQPLTFKKWLKQHYTLPISDNKEGKELSQITDEDAIEVLKLLGIMPKADWNKDYCRKWVYGFFTDTFSTKYDALGGLSVIKAYQYLQSRGYKLPTYY